MYEYSNSSVPYGYADGYHATPLPLPITSPPTLGETSRRFNGEPISEPKFHDSQFSLSNGEWCINTFVNRTLRKSVPIAEWFSVHSVINVLDPNSKALLNVLIRYVTHTGEHSAVLSADEFSRGNFIKALYHVRRKPDCSKSQANALAEFLIHQAPTAEIILFPHPGYFMNDEMLRFVSYSDLQLLPEKVVPDSIRCRKILPMSAPDATIQAWKRLYGSDPLLTLLALISVGSLLLGVFQLFDIKSPFMLTIRPSDGISAEQLIAMLRYSEYPAPDLMGSIPKLQHYLTAQWDCIALFHDTSFADEAQKIEPNLRELLREVLNADSSARKGRNIIAIVSEHGASTTQRLGPDNVFSISMNGVNLHASSAEIHHVTKQMESVVISTVLANPNELFAFFNQEKQRLSTHIELAEDNHAAFNDLITFLAMTLAFLRSFLHIEMLSLDQLTKLLNGLQFERNHAQTADQEIVQDFAQEISKCFRTGEFSMLPKCKNIQLDPNGRTVIIQGDRFYMNRNMLEAALERMTTTHNLRGLINALKNLKLLVSTDGDTHPIEVHDLHGAAQRLYWYDISVELLDADIVHKLNNIGSEQFWLTSDEIPEHDFLALLCDSIGRVAGRLVRQQDAENGHIYLTGQTGIGKTHTSCQLMAKLCSLGHRVICFDDSDSLTYDAMCHNLPQAFVDAKVTFWDIEKNGLPVDIFRVDRTATLPTQKRLLLSVLNAGVGELSAPQRNRLSSVLSKKLSFIKPDEPIRTNDLLAMLQEDGVTYESLRSRLEPIFEDIDDLGMVQQSWADVFSRNNGKIIVIQTGCIGNGRGNQLIDMMLSNLFIYQQETPVIPLDIFVDEVQNQNVSTESPIARILREGRKFHCAFIGTTQDFYPFKNEVGKIMSKADTCIFHRPTPNSESAVAASLRFNKTDMSRFDAMQRGDAIAKGAFYSTAEKRNIPTILSGKLSPFDEPDFAESAPVTG